MQRATIYRAGDPPRRGRHRAIHRRALAWLAAAAISPVLLGCASATGWTEGGWPEAGLSASWWSGEAEAEAEADADAVAATAPTEDPMAIQASEAAEDPEVTEAFARLQQAQLDMRQRQAQAAATIAHANRASDSTPASSAATVR